MNSARPANPSVSKFLIYIFPVYLQSRYFDCDDDSDTYSNLSNIIVDETDMISTGGDNQSILDSHFYCNGEHNCNYETNNEYSIENDGID